MKIEVGDEKEWVGELEEGIENREEIERVLGKRGERERNRKGRKRKEGIKNTNQIIDTFS